MKIAYPVTDYIPASILTTEGDVLRRGVAIPERVARSPSIAYLAGLNAAGYPSYRTLAGVVNTYFKCQGAAAFPLFEALALRDTGIFIGSNMRNSGGDQVITGIGFEASCVIFMAQDNTGANLNWSIGFDSVALQAFLGCRNGGTELFNTITRSIYIQRDVGNILDAYILSIGADGFTIRWSLTGACVVDFIYVCLP